MTDLSPETFDTEAIPVIPGQRRIVVLAGTQRAAREWLTRYFPVTDNLQIMVATTSGQLDGLGFAECEWYFAEDPLVRMPYDLLLRYQQIREQHDKPPRRVHHMDPSGYYYTQGELA